MLKIGEFSQLGRVSVRMLRHYDSLGLLEPTHVDYLSGYRFYAVEQLPKLNRVLALKDLGLSLEQISRLLEREELPAAELRGMLAMRRAELERELRDGRQRLGRIEARLRRIDRENEPSPYEVVLKGVAPQTVVSARTVVPGLSDMPDYRCSLYEGLHGWLRTRGVDGAGPELAIYHVAEHRETEIDTEVAVVVDPGSLEGEDPPPLPGARTAVRGLAAAGKVASVVHRGPLWGVPDAIGALFAWIGQNGYSASGPYREIHLFWRENDMAEKPGGLDDVVTELQLPVEKTASIDARQ